MYLNLFYHYNIYYLLFNIRMSMVIVLKKFKDIKKLKNETKI